MQTINFTVINTVSKEDAVSLAVNGLGTVDGANALCNVSVKATGAKFVTGSTICQDSTPVTEFTPQYLATPVLGCKALSICTAANLASIKAEFEDYSIVYVDTYAFIYGNLNFTQLDNGYTPQITSAKSVVYALWK